MSSEDRYNRKDEKEVKKLQHSATTSHLQNLNRAVSLVALIYSGHYEP